MCLNPNCTPGCNCNDCCPPVTPPTPPTPPTCSGTDCVELYDGNCVKYTGPAVTCFGITPNMNFNTIVSLMANTLCKCGNSCINPLELFFTRIKKVYSSIMEKNPSLDRKNILYDVVDDFLKDGFLIKKCQYCCPDGSLYAIIFDKEILNQLNHYFYNNHEEVPCNNCESDYLTCKTSLLSSFDSTETGASISDIIEVSGFNSASGLCILTNILKSKFTYSEITVIFKNLKENGGLSIKCDLENGDILISDLNPYIN